MPLSLGYIGSGLPIISVHGASRASSRRFTGSSPALRDQEDFAALSRLAMASHLLAGNLAYISARLFGSDILSSIIRLTNL